MVCGDALLYSMLPYVHVTPAGIGVLDVDVVHCVLSVPVPLDVGLPANILVLISNILPLLIVSVPLTVKLPDPVTVLSPLPLQVKLLYKPMGMFCAAPLKSTVEPVTVYVPPLPLVRAPDILMVPLNVLSPLPQLMSANVPPTMVCALLL